MKRAKFWVLLCLFLPLTAFAVFDYHCINLPTTPFNYANIWFPSDVVNNLTEMDNMPTTNPTTDAGATLGRVLFYDEDLSRNHTISCASCHQQAFSFTDTARFSRGFNGGLTSRNSMGLIHARFQKDGAFFWDNRANSLETQALMPIVSTVEMGLTLDTLAARVAAKSFYPPLFQAAFGSSTVTTDKIAKAIAQFVRSMNTFGSKFRQGVETTNGNPSTTPFANFTAQENLGKDLFMDETRGNCQACHTRNVMVQQGSKNIGLDLVYADNGVGAATGNANKNGQFSVPSLINIELTAPYMHDGRFKTLEQVVNFYSDSIKAHPNLDGFLRQILPGTIDPNNNPCNTCPPRIIHYTPTEKQALVAFLKTLTDTLITTDPRWSNPFCIETCTSAISGNSQVCGNQANTYTVISSSIGNTYVWNISGSYSIISGGGTNNNSCTLVWTGGTTGNISVAVTTISGCSSTATLNITRSVPTASNNSPACVGTSVTLSANPNPASGLTATSYAWNGAAGTASIQNPIITNITASKAGIYTVTVTYSNGCTATATTAITVNTSPLINSVTPSCVSGLGKITVNATGTGLSYNIGTGAQTSNVFNGLTNGTYTVTVTNSMGCTAKSSTNVLCQTCPVVTASSNSPVCTGSDIMLSVNPNLPTGVTASYLWSGPAGTTTLQNPIIANAIQAKMGVYTVTVTYSNACTATASTTVSLSPTITGSITGPSVLCTGSSAVLTASGGGTYLWNTGATTAAITINTAGTYAVTIRNGTGCKRLNKTVTSSTCKEGEQPETWQHLSIAPNPFSTYAVIDFMSNSTGRTNIKLYGIDGKQVATLYNANTQAGETYQVTLDRANLPNGMYFVKMTNANGETMLQKAMINR